MAVLILALPVLAQCAPARVVQADHIPRAYALIWPYAKSAEAALHHISAQLRRTLASAGAVPHGYPRPCSVKPSGAAGAALPLRDLCAEVPASASKQSGLRLNPQGEYILLSVVDYPDSRAHLTAVYLVPELPHPRLSEGPASDLPRVCVHYPLVSPALAPSVWASIRSALLEAGARPVP